MKQKKTSFLVNVSATYGGPLQYQSLTQLIIYEVNTCNFLFFFCPFILSIFNEILNMQLISKKLSVCVLSKILTAT